MPDKDNVIKGLEICKKFKPGECLGCPYYPSFNCLTNLHDDAIALLKEQDETELCDRCGRVRLKSSRIAEGR